MQTHDTGRVQEPETTVPSPMIDPVPRWPSGLNIAPIVARGSTSPVVRMPVMITHQKAAAIIAARASRRRVGCGGRRRVRTGYGVCTPTGTPTSSIPRLFRGFRGYSETYCELRKQVTREYVRTPNLSLGVKWSQVQILSARPKFPQAGQAVVFALGEGGPATIVFAATRPERTRGLDPRRHDRIPRRHRVGRYRP